MTVEHKVAIAAVRIEAAAVRDNLVALETHRPRRGRQVSPETLAERRAGIESQLAVGGLKAIKRLELLQARRDIHAALEALDAESDMTEVEKGFVAHAASYGQRRGIEYPTWREAGLPAELLARAGITRGK